MEQSGYMYMQDIAAKVPVGSCDVKRSSIPRLLESMTPKIAKVKSSIRLNLMYLAQAGPS